MLNSYPHKTNTADAAKAISRAVIDSTNGSLNADIVDAARRVLGELAQKPEPAAIHGLVDAVVAGACADGVNAFVLTASAWRALVALTDSVRDKNDAARILSAAATSAIAVLERNETKKVRVVRFYVANAAKFAMELEKNHVVPDGCPSAVADLCGLLALQQSGDAAAEMQKLSAPAAIVLRVAFGGCNDWKAALCARSSVGKLFEDVAAMRVVVAIYLSRVARSVKDQDPWNKLCEKKLVTDIIPFLFHVLETCGVQMLDVHEPSICTMIMSTLKNLCDVCNTNTMLEYVSSPSILVSRAASVVLIERAKYGDNQIVGYVRECRLISEALQSPLATQRWKPLERVICGSCDGDKHAHAKDTTLDNAIGLPLLRRMKVVLGAEKQARMLTDRRKKFELEQRMNRVRVGVSEVNDGNVQALARAVVSDNVDEEYVEKETNRMELIAKYARVLVTSSHSTNRTMTSSQNGTFNSNVLNKNNRH